MSDSQEQAGFTAPELSELGPLFPGYEMEGLIATGGMGAVYCAVQRSLDRNVAIKILPRELSRDAAFCAGFEAEAKAMARLNHPNLVGVYDFGEVNGMLYIIMEYVPGHSIYHAAYGKAIDQNEVIRLVTGICNGLAHAHEHGIIHRDVKPSNILLDLNAEPKIGDFGLARPIERKVEVGEEIFGTPHYTAPEVVDSPHAVDYRADIFSIGVMLHELLTSKLPANDPRPASAIISCDLRFDAIIKKATQPLPVARYSSAKEMASDLQAIVAHQRTGPPRGPAVLTHSSAVRGKPTRSTIKKPSNAPLYVFLTALVIAGFGVAAFLANKPEVPPVGPTVVILNGAKPTEPRRPSASLEGISTEEVPNDVTEDDSISQEEIPPGMQESEAPAEVAAVPGNPVAAEPPALPAAKFDVSGLLTRAKSIMKERAKPIVLTYQSNMKANVSSFHDTLNRQARRAKNSNKELMKAVEAATTEWSGNKAMPGSLALPLSGIPELQGVFDDYAGKEVGIKDTFHVRMAQLATVYIGGLEMQMERLKTAGDPGAVALLEIEMQKARKAPEYFVGLMVGSE